MIFMMLIPLCLGTRTGRPSDAPFPLCLCKTPALPSHVRLNRRGNGSRLSVASAMDWFKCDWEVAADYGHLVNLRPSRSVHCHILLPFGCSCTYLTTADAANLLLVFAEADHLVQPCVAIEPICPPARLMN